MVDKFETDTSDIPLDLQRHQALHRIALCKNADQFNEAKAALLALGGTLSPKLAKILTSFETYRRYVDGPEIETFDDKVRKSAAVETYDDIVRKSVVPDHRHDPFLNMLRRAGDFAAMMSRSVTGWPAPKKPKPPLF